VSKVVSKNLVPYRCSGVSFINARQEVRKQYVKIKALSLHFPFF